jgi:hypothetical protein
MRGDVDVDANLSSSPSAQEQSGDNFADDSTKSPESKRSSSIMNSIRAGKEDGDIKDVGFVSFRNLRSTMAALQMVHHESPFEMQRQEAPLPEDILWNNIGKSNKQLQLGKLLSLTLTTTLCLLWTIPVSFVAALNDVDALQDLIPFLEDWIETAPWLSDVLAQLAPLLVVVLIALLPTILLVITKLEGSISDSSEQASLFLKLSAFMVRSPLDCAQSFLSLICIYLRCCLNLFFISNTTNNARLFKHSLYLPYPAVYLRHSKTLLMTHSLQWICLRRRYLLRLPILCKFYSSRHLLVWESSFFGLDQLWLPSSVEK